MWEIHTGDADAVVGVGAGTVRCCCLVSHELYTLAVVVALAAAALFVAAVGPAAAVAAPGALEL